MEQELALGHHWERFRRVKRKHQCSAPRPCALCGEHVDEDPDFDIYTESDCQVVCLRCARERDPALADFCEQFRNYRALGQAEVVTTEEIDNDSLGFQPLRPLAVVHLEGGTVTREL